MRHWVFFIFLVITTGIVACISKAPSSASSDERRLLELHEAGLKAHIDRDIEALLATQAEDLRAFESRRDFASSKQQPIWPEIG
jgi:hypothetical protein